MVFAVQCPNPQCRKYMLVEEHDQGKQIQCLICKSAIRVGSKGPQPSSPSPPTANRPTSSNK